MCQKDGHFLLKLTFEVDSRNYIFGRKVFDSQKKNKTRPSKTNIILLLQSGSKKGVVTRRKRFECTHEY